MSNENQTHNPANDLTCPECRAALKRRRSRNADECEMVCGGCGQTFDVCDMDTLADLKKKAP
jgi:Trm112p-like protein